MELMFEVPKTKIMVAWEIYKFEDAVLPDLLNYIGYSSSPFWVWYFGFGFPFLEPGSVFSFCSLKEMLAEFTFIQDNIDRGNLTVDKLHILINNVGIEALHNYEEKLNGTSQ